MTTITRVYRADWAPHIEQAARQFARLCVVVFCAGFAFGRWLHRLNDRLSALLVRQHFPRYPNAQYADALEEIDAALEQFDRPVIFQRCAVAAVPARCGIMAPTPMARAISKVKGGMSQRKAATLCGVSRTSLQRALRA